MASSYEKLGQLDKAETGLRRLYADYLGLGRQLWETIDSLNQWARVLVKLSRTEEAKRMIYLFIASANSDRQVLVDAMPSDSVKLLQEYITFYEERLRSGSDEDYDEQHQCQQFKQLIVFSERQRNFNPNTHFEDRRRERGTLRPTHGCLERASDSRIDQDSSSSGERDVERQADLFEPKEKHDKICEEEYRAHLEWKLAEHPQWKVSEGFIKERLRATMLLRHRRLFFYSRNSVQDHVSAQVPGPREMSGLLAPTTKTAVSSEDLKDSPLTRGMQDRQIAITTQTESMLLKGLSSFELIAGRGSATASRGTESLVGLKKHYFPKAPAISPGVSGFMCPLCRRLQPLAKHKPWLWQ